MDNDSFEPLDEMPDANKPNPLDDVAAQKKLRDYMQAMQEEFGLTQGTAGKPTDLTDEQIRDKVKKRIAQGVPQAVARVIYLTEHAKSEAVQQRCAFYIIDHALGKDAGGLVGDPFEQLLRQVNAGANHDDTEE